MAMTWIWLHRPGDFYSFFIDTLYVVSVSVEFQKSKKVTEKDISFHVLRA